MLTMRWDNLFDDLESQLEAEIESAEQVVHVDEERHRQAHLTLHERLRNVSENCPEDVGLTLATGRDVTVAILRLGRDWCAVDVISPAALEGHALVPIAAVIALNPTTLQVVASLGDAVAGHTTPVAAGASAPRLVDTVGLGFVLRDLARRRRAVEIHSLHGVFVGTLDRVGVDHCDLAEHLESASRRQSNVLRYRVLSLASISLVRML